MNNLILFIKYSKILKLSAMDNKELSKLYDPSEVEGKWYQEWMDKGHFSPSDGNNTFTIMIPPPNITGILHVGHILNNTIQDVLIRKARMQGKSTLWQPGTDHASIATEAKVTKMLVDKGINKKDIGREKFLEHSMEWKEEYGETILKQLMHMGASCDWDKTKFTMDPEYSQAVIKAFVELYDDGLIYKGERMVNWDPVGLTAVSDEEVVHKETSGKLWHFKYPVTGTDEFLVVATTRPETMLGDTGVAVHPDDERYKKYIGKTVTLPIVGREIPIFSDNYVDMEFGTGCVKVTPAHDPNDFEMGSRNKLDVINIMNINGSLNDNVPNEYQGLDRYDARKKVVKDLDNIGSLDKIEDYVHKVGYSERTDAVIEPYLSEQWFLKMDKLVQPALDAVNSGEIKFYPERWIKTYNHWLANITDWCISRQLWWGHQIPVWYKDGEVYCGVEPPQGDGWEQEEDVLDTWFSSWLWPFATLGWPKKTKNLKKFYPTQDLVTGPDIIFFWVARMIMAGYYFIGDKPFSNVYFNGIIRDSQGRKMSKSLGNSPDPIELMDKYGADALRVGLLMIAPQGLDIRFSEDKIEHGRNFMNKLWNSARFVMMNLDEIPRDGIDSLDDSMLDDTDKWIISELNSTIKNVNSAYEKYRMNDAIKLIYDFVYGNFCDWYIEFSKSRLYGSDDTDRKTCQIVCVETLNSILKLLHPYCPHITEEISSHISGKESTLLIASEWPRVNLSKINTQIESNIKTIMSLISSIRNIKISFSISPKKDIDIHCRGNKEILNVIDSYKAHLNRMVHVKNIVLDENLKKPQQSTTIVIGELEIFIPLSGVIDIDKETERLNKQISNLNGRLNSVNSKLDNKNFVKNAPEKVVNHERNKQEKYQQEHVILTQNLKSIVS